MPFYKYCDAIYYEYKTDLGYESGYDDELARELGFLKDRFRSYYPNYNHDVEMFLDATFYLSEDEFKEEYGSYPVIMAKYEALKGLITELGYNF